MSDAWLNPKAIPLDAETSKRIIYNNERLPHKVRTFCPVCKKYYNSHYPNDFIRDEDVYAIYLIKRAHNKHARVWMPEADLYDETGLLVYSSGDFPSHYSEKENLMENWTYGTEGEFE